MKTFEIEVQELLARRVKVRAKNFLDAKYKVEELYKKCKIVLDYNDFVLVDFIDIDIDSSNKIDEKNALIKDVIEYLYNEEKRHFEELDKPQNHIFSKLEKLKLLVD